MTDNVALKDGREFHFTRRDFERVRKMIYEHAGISLSDSKQELVYSRLSRRLRATGIPSFGEYLRLLESNDEDEWESFTNSLTTNLTAFFREQHHFPILAEYLKKNKGRHFTLWCSAASTGEEPYSMAMTAVEALGGFDIPVSIIATDLDTHVLETAKAGIYAEDRVSKLPQEMLKKFFQRGTGDKSGYVRVRKELRDMITFRKVNLLDNNWPLRAPVDIIFCRNVMIYFDKPTQLDILKKFVPLMSSDGLLFAGHSESFQNADDLLHLRGKTVYELAPALKGQRSAEEARERTA